MHRDQKLEAQSRKIEWPPGTETEPTLVLLRARKLAWSGDLAAASLVTRRYWPDPV